MIRAVLADSGPLFAAVEMEDEYHLQARRQLDIFEQERRAVLLPHSILLEADSLVLYRLGVTAAQKWITLNRGLSH